MITKSTYFTLPDSTQTMIAEAVLLGGIVGIGMIAILAFEFYKRKQPYTAVAMGVAAVICAVVLTIFGINTSGLMDSETSAQHTVKEIEEEYNVEFYSNNLQEQLMSLNSVPPTERETVTLENLFYVYQDKTYSTNLAIISDVGENSEPTITLLASSGSEDMVPFNPEAGNLTNSDATQSEDK